MRNRRRQFAIAGFIAGVALLALAPVSTGNAARFVKSINRLYVDFQKLSTDPNDKAKYFIYAIIRPRCPRCPKTYFIMSETNNTVRYMGAFRCDKSFEVMPQTTHGMKNILCKNWTNRNGAEIARFLRFDRALNSYK